MDELFDRDEFMDNWDERCMVCGADLPENPRPGSVQAQGYCSLRCKRWDDFELEDRFER